MQKLRHRNTENGPKTSLVTCLPCRQGAGLKPRHFVVPQAPSCSVGVSRPGGICGKHPGLGYQNRVCKAFFESQVASGVTSTKDYSRKDNSCWKKLLNYMWFFLKAFIKKKKYFIEAPFQIVCLKIDKLTLIQENILETILRHKIFLWKPNFIYVPQVPLLLVGANRPWSGGRTEV